MGVPAGGQEELGWPWKVSWCARPHSTLTLLWGPEASGPVVAVVAPSVRGRCPSRSPPASGAFSLLSSPEPEVRPQPDKAH